MTSGNKPTALLYTVERVGRDSRISAMIDAAETSYVNNRMHVFTAVRGSDQLFTFARMHMRPTSTYRRKCKMGPNFWEGVEYYSAVLDVRMKDEAVVPLFIFALAPKGTWTGTAPERSVAFAQWASTQLGGL